MRICLISREYPPDTGWGGIATFTRHLAVGLTEIGHEVEVVSLAAQTAGTVEQDGILVHRVHPHRIPGDLGATSLCMPYSRYVLKTSTGLWKKFLELHCKRPFDVVDTPELLAEGLVPAITKAVPLLIRLYTPHSKFIAERLHNVSPSFDHQFVAMLERMAMLNADVITSPSEDLADFVAADLDYRRQNIHIVRNPIDPDEFSASGPCALPASAPTVLFVGRLEERKGIHYLIRAVPEIVKEVPNVRLVIIGDDTNNGKDQRSVRSELEAIIRSNRVADSVTFIPRVPLSELPAYYRSADVCVVPSVYDNSPYTCLEAMSCGKPVVASSAGGTREYVVHGESGLIVPPRDTSALAEAIVYLLTNSGERARMGANARQRVLHEFQRTEIARQTARLYEEARGNFARRAEFRLYLKDAGDALPDADAFLYFYDKMLYDLLYQFSWRFRIRHWWRLATKRPRLLLAKVAARLLRTGLELTGSDSEHQAGLLYRLEQEIRERQRILPVEDGADCQSVDLVTARQKRR